MKGEMNMGKYYSDDLIVKRVSKAIRERTRENMDVHMMSLNDAFSEAVRECGTKSKELLHAWYFSDYRKYIPSAYIPDYLDFNKYPLRYSVK